MKILIAMLSAGFAGTERHSMELAGELVRQGMDVALLLRSRPVETHRQSAYDALRRAIPAGVTVYYASRAAPVFALWRALLTFRPDVIHVHHERAARLVSRYGRTAPVVATVHVHYTSRNFQHCDGLICLTQTEAAALPASFKGVIRVVGNWVMPHPRPAPATLARLRDELGLSGAGFVIGSVARLEPVKGIAGLLTAFRDAAIPAAKLVLAGEGSERKALEQLAQTLGIEAQVVFAGFRPDVRDLYYLFNAFVLNSTDEPYGLAILEAAGSGVPVICAASAGPIAIAEHLPIALIPRDDTAALARALAAAAREPAPWYDMATFTVATKTRETIAAYRDIAAARGKIL